MSNIKTTPQEKLCPHSNSTTHYIQQQQSSQSVSVAELYIFTGTGTTVYDVVTFINVTEMVRTYEESGDVRM